MFYYLGKRPHGDLILFECDGRPTRESTAGRFTSAIGPFASHIGASYCARYHCIPSDAERLAREDPNPVWQALREQIEFEDSLPPEELAEFRQCLAEEYEPDRSSLGAIDVTDMLRQSLTLEALYQE